MERCNELHKKIEELSSQMGQALDAVGTENLPSRSDFATMKEDLAFREGEVAKSKQTLEGLAAEQGQLKVNFEVFINTEEKIYNLNIFLDFRSIWRKLKPLRRKSKLRWTH